MHRPSTDLNSPSIGNGGLPTTMWQAIAEIMSWPSRRCVRWNVEGSTGRGHYECSVQTDVTSRTLSKLSGGGPGVSDNAPDVISCGSGVGFLDRVVAIRPKTCEAGRDRREADLIFVRLCGPWRRLHALQKMHICKVIVRDRAQIYPTTKPAKRTQSNS